MYIPKVFRNQLYAHFPRGFLEIVLIYSLYTSCPCLQWHYEEPPTVLCVHMSLTLIIKTLQQPVTNGIQLNATIEKHYVLPSCGQRFVCQCAMKNEPLN